MNDEQRMVHDFHERFGLRRNEAPTWPGEVVHRHRVMLIDEELAELRNAGEAGDLARVADALGDLLYVVYGAGVAYGIDLEPVFAEIHRSNLTKVAPASHPDGKACKGEGYSAPDLVTVLDRQLGSLPVGG
ncbi:MAG: hypothetical protein M3024_12655 [Candidatus Dormibacteraeota bacterium]|nr:hypothetical protein [Candidatus Dormibacteraeota bacterium]